MAGNSLSLPIISVVLRGDGRATFLHRNVLDVLANLLTSRSRAFLTFTPTHFTSIDDDIRGRADHSKGFWPSLFLLGYTVPPPFPGTLLHIPYLIYRPESVGRSSSNTRAFLVLYFP